MTGLPPVIPTHPSLMTYLCQLLVPAPISLDVSRAESGKGHHLFDQRNTPSRSRPAPRRRRRCCLFLHPGPEKIASRLWVASVEFREIADSLAFDDEV